jgi:hypothetical protein
MDIGHRAQRIVALPLALLMAVAVAYAAADAITASRPAPADPSFFDTIIASDAVVAAIRIAVVAAAGYGLWN